MNLSVVGCSTGADTPLARSDVASSPAKAAVVAPGWKEVSYRGATFDVPSEWAVSTVETYEWSCATYGRPGGVFLASDDPQGQGCPRTSEHAMTLHVGPFSAASGPGGAEVITAGGTEMWVRHTDANAWFHAAFPSQGIFFVFYEVDPAVRAAILATVAGA
jgi:hypothetical protein